MSTSTSSLRQRLLRLSLNITTISDFNSVYISPRQHLYVSPRLVNISTVSVTLSAAHQVNFFVTSHPVCQHFYRLSDFVYRSKSTSVITRLNLFVHVSPSTSTTVRRRRQSGESQGRGGNQGMGIFLAVVKARQIAAANAMARHGSSGNWLLLSATQIGSAASCPPQAPPIISTRPP